MFRILGPKVGVPVALIDFAKGLLATLLLPLLSLGMGERGPVVTVVQAQILIACGAVIGHAFPVFAGFRGGKGVATGAGAIVGMLPLLGAACATLFALVLFSTGIVSLSSLSAAASMVPIYLLVEVWARGRWDPYLLGFLAGITVVIGILHRRNIRRLASGEEPRYERLRLLRVRRRHKAD